MTPVLPQQIFVVDDDEDDQFMIHQALAEHIPLVTIDVFADGEALLRSLSQASMLPHLVLLDLNMPRMGGLEALEHIRSNQLYTGLPVIMLTTSDSAEDRARAQALKADGYFVKPSTVSHLNQLILTVKQQWLQSGQS
ncbi:response regulator [Spirosoma oryzicola]|uniref:response regulator n=1 Tax=Spirosoma oryzicola TaxID=2898794 RepID=UPI001E5CA6BC|nr:response regulator [Spirosoma oryzicola]UHG94367.1 response regulator [Spirosoma oryzicola]